MRWKEAKMEYTLRPAKADEVNLFYSAISEGADALLCTVGHLRGDFDSGNTFHTTW